MSLVFTHLQVHHLPVVLAALLLTSLTFALGGFLNALFAKNFDQVNWIPTFVLTPLTYFGGVFYSVSLLPGWARTLSLRESRSSTWSTRFATASWGYRTWMSRVAFALMVGAAVVLFTAAVTLMNRGTGTRE